MTRRETAIKIMLLFDVVEPNAWTEEQLKKIEKLLTEYKKSC